MEKREGRFKQYITDTFVLNPPKCNYLNIDSLGNELIYIYKDQFNAIPCLFIQDTNQCSKFLICFHGNNEDILESEMFAIFFRDYINMNIFVVEYPGYSIYLSKKDPNIILSDSIIVYDWIKSKFGAKDENIYIYGRSIGSAPAIYLASQRNAKALFVVSGFSTLKNVGKGLYVGWAIEDIFKNIENIKQVKIPTLFIHGKKDKLIDYNNTLELYNKCPVKEKDYKFIEDMTHNEYDPIKHIFNNINTFLNEKVRDEKAIEKFYNLYDIKFNEIFNMPKNIKSWLNGLNFKLTNYEESENFKEFNDVNDIILLIDERLAIVYKKKIEICDLLLFNKYFTIKYENSDIIFVIQLKNGNLLVCDSNGDMKFYKLELTKSQFLFNCKLSINVLNFCKIIELNNKNLLSVYAGFYSLTEFKLNEKTNQYDQEFITCYKNITFNDIIELPGYQIALLSKNRNLLIFHDYNSKETKFQSILPQHNTEILQLYLYKSKLILLGENNIYIYDITTKNNRNYKFFEGSYQKLCGLIPGTAVYPTFLLSLNSEWLLIGNKNGNLFKCDYQEINETLVEVPKDSFLKVESYPIKKILLLPDKRFITLSSKKNLRLYQKIIKSNQQACNIF